ncbi:hypothetical protein OS493_003046 [Desmophyllum pertusum]|uniref:Lipoxygenase domain-containing protein n=1 Tax=Desmophyllum pertusum TaxID=174260 RepID=A0A9X0CIU9_9CNID|nr:hypothetical protein OS493_003046 [Desmophyllum pertusum]
MLILFHQNRGLDDRKLLPYFPFRDDGLIILKVIEHLVKDYVNLYYKQDKDVEEDVEIQAFLNEVSLSGTGPNGGIGRIKGLPASIDSKEELCDIIQSSAFLALGSLRIDALFDYGNELQDTEAGNLVNSFYGYLMDVVQPRMQELNQKRKKRGYLTYPYFIPEWLPNGVQDLVHYRTVEDGEFNVFRLPNHPTAAIQSSAFLALGSLRIDALFDYGNELQDTEAGNLVNSFYGYLMGVVQPRMQELNQKRKKRGYLTYPYFIPEWLPNGVQDLVHYRTFVALDRRMY